MTPEEMRTIKLAWATGETVQGRDRGEVTWCDWTNDISLDLAYWDEYRVKPKPIKVYLWATIHVKGTNLLCSYSRTDPAVAEVDRRVALRLGAKCTEIVEVELEMPE